MANFINLHRDF